MTRRKYSQHITDKELIYQIYNELLKIEEIKKSIVREKKGLQGCALEGSPKSHDQRILFVTTNVVFSH